MPRLAKDRPRRRSSKEAILDAACEVLEERGLAGFSTFEVASRVPISEPSVFYHFGDRDSLLMEVAVRIAAAEFAALRAAAEGGRDAREAFDAVFQARAAFYEGRANALELVHFWGFPRADDERRAQASAWGEGIWDILEAKVAAEKGHTPDLRLQIICAWLALDGFALTQLRILRGHIVLPWSVQELAARMSALNVRGILAPDEERGEV